MRNHKKERNQFHFFFKFSGNHTFGQYWRQELPWVKSNIGFHHILHVVIASKTNVFKTSIWPFNQHNLGYHKILQLKKRYISYKKSVFLLLVNNNMIGYLFCTNFMTIQNPPIYNQPFYINVTLKPLVKLLNPLKFGMSKK